MFSLGRLIKKTIKISVFCFLSLFILALVLKLLLPSEGGSGSVKTVAEKVVLEKLVNNSLNKSITEESAFPNTISSGKCLPDSPTILEKKFEITEKADVSKNSIRKLDVKGVVFADLFGPMGGQEFNSAPQDSKCLAQFLEHALAGPLRIGAEWIGFVPAAWYQQVKPFPVIGTALGMNESETNYHSLTDENYYAALIKAAKERGLKVAHTEQLALGLGLASEQIAAFESLKKEGEWLDEWFNQWEKWVVARAVRAEKYKVEMFVLFLYPEDLSEIYPQFNDRWKNIIREVRKVYSGEIAMNFYGAPNEKITYVEDLDAILVTADGNLYRFISGLESDKGMKDVYNPSVEELIPIAKRIFAEGVRERFIGKLPVYAVLVANSADGQNDSEVLERRGKVDFQEQAVYYEAFFRALLDEPVIKGVFTERWDWWDQFKRPTNTAEAKYFDATTGASPRSKPAEEVNKNWFEIY